MEPIDFDKVIKDLSLLNYAICTYRCLRNTYGSTRQLDDAVIKLMNVIMDNQYKEIRRLLNEIVYELRNVK